MVVRGEGGEAVVMGGVGEEDCRAVEDGREGGARVRLRGSLRGGLVAGRGGGERRERIRDLAREGR